MTPPLPLTELPKDRLQRLENLHQALIEVLDLAKPMARDCGTQILVALPAHLPPLAILPEVFRQLLLGLLAPVLALSCGDATTLQVRLASDVVEFEARSVRSNKDHQLDPAAFTALRLRIEEVLGDLKDTSTPAEPALCMRLPVALG